MTKTGLRKSGNQTPQQPKEEFEALDSDLMEPEEFDKDVEGSKGKSMATGAMDMSAFSTETYNPGKHGK